MKQLPTADDFLQDHLQISHFYDDKTEQMVCFSSDVQQAMIEFAKLHVEAALKEAAEKAKIKYEYSGNTGSEYCDEYVDQNSILNAYPLTNIK